MIDVHGWQLFLTDAEAVEWGRLVFERATADRAIAKIRKRCNRRRKKFNAKAKEANA